MDNEGGSGRNSSGEEQEIVTLSELLEAFGAPLNEEQAWALCYQCGIFISGDKSNLWNFRLDGAGGVLLSKEGNVRLAGGACESTGFDTQAETNLINSLGRVIYQALDYGLSEEEERELSHPLEELIEFMTTHDISEEENSNDNNNVASREEASDSLNVDEGIVDGQDWDEEEDDGGGGGGDRLSGSSSDVIENRTVNISEENNKQLQRIATLLKLCARHIPQPSEAPSHYQAVCRAVYAEYHDLATFLKRISGSKEILRNLSEPGDDVDGHVEDLQPRQWAKIWLNVVRDLRNGVKLKKLSEQHERHRAPIEYALTPYEMLMDDIRSRRYSLNKVMVDGKIPPRLKKEAHDIVLDFIRSRPPLKPVPKDKLRQLPLRKESVHEILMKEIRSQPELKPVPPTDKPDGTKTSSTSVSKKKRLGSYMSENSESEDEELMLNLDATSPQRKVLRAEFTLDWSEEESESETSMHESDSYSRPKTSRLSREPSLAAPAIDTRNDGNQFYQVQEEEGDERDGNDILERAIQKILDDDVADADNRVFLLPSLPQETMSSTPKTLTISRSSLSSFDEIRSDEIPKESPRRHSIGPCQSYKDPGKPLPYKEDECLSLTVEEVIHIRSVLVKAEIENLRVDAKLYRAVIQDKVCFACKKKFTLFKKKLTCRLCKKLICKGCCVKMFIPKEEFLHIPVNSLTPSNPSTPKKSPIPSPTRNRSVSDPPTPFLVPTPVRNRRLQNLHIWHKPTPVENVCCECCRFLKNARTGPTPTPMAPNNLPTPFNPGSSPLQKLNSIST